MAPLLSIIGAGRVGKTLARLWHVSGYIRAGDVLNRQFASAQHAAEFIGAGTPIGDLAQLRGADIFLLALPDDQIAITCQRLADSGKIRPGNIVFHCSGALASNALASAVRQGARVASVHPIRSFADPGQVAASFHGTVCGVEGDVAALAVLDPLFDAIGAKRVPILAASKTLYHAAAVFASNYLVSLLAVAQQSYVKAGVAPEVALQLLVPLVRETAENVFRLGPAGALTGPIARGDLATVARQQLAVTQWDAAYGQLYAELAAATTRLAADRPMGGHETGARGHWPCPTSS